MVFERLSKNRRDIRDILDSRMDDGYDFFFKQLPFFQYPYVGKEKSIPFPTTAMAPAAKRPMPEVTFTGVANRFAR